MRKLHLAALLVIFGALLTRPAYAGSGEFIGTLVGAGTGGYIGSMFGHGAGRLAATGAGVFIGGAIGNEIGYQSDHSYGYYARSYYPAYYYPSTVYYAPPPTVYYVSSRYAPNYVAPPDPPPVAVNQTYGSYCREYSQQVRIGGQVQESYGTACLQPDGSWKIVQ